MILKGQRGLGGVGSTSQWGRDGARVDVQQRKDPAGTCPRCGARLMGAAEDDGPRCLLCAYRGEVRVGDYDMFVRDRSRLRNRGHIREVEQTAERLGFGSISPGGRGDNR